MNNKRKEKLMEVPCQVCGKPVFLQDLPEVGEGDTTREQVAGVARLGAVMRRAMIGLSRMVVHSEKAEAADGPTCYDTMLNRWRKRKEDELLAERMSTLAGTVPPEFQDTDLGHHTMRTTAALAALGWQYGPHGLLLVGPAGEGKSRCAYAVLHREHLSGRVCCQYTAGEWAYRCLGMTHDFKAFDRWIRVIKNCDILCVDDLGKARLTYQDHQATQATELLFDAVDYRCKNQLPTFVTTNLTGSDFKARWGEHGNAFLRRLIQFSYGVRFGPIGQGEKLLFGKHSAKPATGKVT